MAAPCCTQPVATSHCSPLVAPSCTAVAAPCCASVAAPRCLAVPASSSFISQHQAAFSKLGPRSPPVPALRGLSGSEVATEASWLNTTSYHDVYSPVIAYVASLEVTVEPESELAPCYMPVPTLPRTLPPVAASRKLLVPALHTVLVPTVHCSPGAALVWPWSAPSCLPKFWWTAWTHRPRSTSLDFPRHPGEAP